MALNPMLILAGSNPDIAGGVFRADEAGFNQGQRNRENALQQFQRDQGAAMLGGDREALNQFAQFSPEGAFSFRGQVEGREQAIAARQAAAARAAAAQRSSADQEEIERTLAFSAAVANSDPENWEARMESRGYADFLNNSGITNVEDFNRAAPGLYAHYGVDAPAPRELTEVNGQLVYADTPGDFRTPEGPPEGWTDMSAAETGALGYPAGAYQRNTDGQVRQVGGSGVSVSVDARGPDANKFDEAASSVIVGEMGETAAAGSQAQRSLVQLGRLEAAIAATPGGMIAGAQAWLGGMGIATTGLGDVQVAEAIISQLVPQQRPPGSGVMSDADLALFKLSLPRLMNSPEGNAEIINVIRGVAQYDIQMGNIARQALLSEITPRQAFDAYQAVENPLAAYSAPQGRSRVPPVVPPEGAETAPIQSMQPAQISAMTLDEFNGLGIDFSNLSPLNLTLEQLYALEAAAVRLGL